MFDQLDGSFDVNMAIGDEIKTIDSLLLLVIFLALIPVWMDIDRRVIGLNGQRLVRW